MRYLRYFQRISIALIVLLTIAPSIHAASRGASNIDDEMDEVSTEELQQQDIPIDQQIFIERWNPVPFDMKYFTYSEEQIERKWPVLTRGLKIPFPSTEYLTRQFQRYPWLEEEIEGFDGDYEALHHRYLNVGRLFLAGNFQAARNEGMKLGAAGRGLAMISQAIYAIYLADRQSVKLMLLQDVVNTAKDYIPRLAEMEKDKEVAPYAVLIRLGYTYALARIAEETAMPIAIARNYAPRIKHNADDILTLMPNHALAMAFRGGVDAGIMRRVGKFTGRMTYGARTTVVEKSFAGAEKAVPDMAIILYERANALIYVHRRRYLNDAMDLYEKASRVKPLFAMEALDSMYAHKRLNEIRLYALHYRSFRKFDKARRKFAKITDSNLTSVLLPALTKEALNEPRQYLEQQENSVSMR
jgi:hypothetical protein